MEEIVWIKDEQIADQTAHPSEGIPLPAGPTPSSPTISSNEVGNKSSVTASTAVPNSSLSDSTFATSNGSLPEAGDSSAVCGGLSQRRSDGVVNRVTFSDQNGDAAIGGEVSWMREEARTGEADEKENELSTAEEFDVSEYERKLRENTEQTMNLVMDLCEKSDALKEQQKSALQRLEEEKVVRIQTAEQMAKVVKLNEQLSVERSELEKEVVSLKQTTESLLKGGTPEISVPGIEWHSVDSIRVGECVLREPTGAVVLSTGNVFVADQQLGLFLFSMNAQLIRHVSDAGWKWAQAATYSSDKQLLVSMLSREDESSTWKRYIYKFDEELRFIARVEGPKWIAEETISIERLCTAPNGFMYLSVAGETFSALYELSPDAKWTELYHKRGQTFVDVQVLAVIGPITELLVVEQRRGYVFMISVRESAICARKSMALVEKPGPICVDELGQLFIVDLRQGKVRQLDTRDSFEPIRDVALAEKALHSISAGRGFLALAYREVNLVRIHKYKSIK